MRPAPGRNRSGTVPPLRDPWAAPPTPTRPTTARPPVRASGDTACGFHVPAAFSTSRRMDVGAQLDAPRLGQKLFGDSAALARLVGRLTNLDVSYGRAFGSTYFSAPRVPAARR